MRFVDPSTKRELWLGLDVGGVALPRRLRLYENRVWTARVTPSWSLALVPGLAVGGRHSMTFYDVTGASSAVRLRVHENQVEVSGAPASARRSRSFTDRLSLGVETHSVSNMRVDGVDIRVGGVRDTIATLGYGMSHPLGRRWGFDWRARTRYAWVFLDTQRHVHGAIRLSYMPRPAHRLSAMGQAYYVHRDRDSAGSQPRHSVSGQFELSYAWMSRHGVGPFVSGRLTSGFLSGEIPIFETRQAAIDGVYGDVTIGLRAVWR